MMDAYIPFEPREPNSEFIIFSSAGSGYMPKGCGARAGFVTKEDEELVPTKEIAKLLMFLQFSEDRFLTVVDGCGYGAPKTEVTGATAISDDHTKE